LSGCYKIGKWFTELSKTLKYNIVRERAEKFCLHLIKKMNGKIYFNEIKKNMPISSIFKAA